MDANPDETSLVARPRFQQPAHLDVKLKPLKRSKVCSNLLCCCLRPLQFSNILQVMSRRVGWLPETTILFLLGSENEYHKHMFNRDRNN